MGENGLTAEQKRLLQRKAWTAEHYRTVGTKLTVQDHERLLKYCQRVRCTRYNLLQSLILELLDLHDSSPW